MTEWYYACGGQQRGPVTFDQLCEIARNGGLDPKDLVWTSTMKDWTPAGQVPGLCVAPASPATPAADPSNPYAPPQSSWIEAAPAAGVALLEIIPGSEPIHVGTCVQRGFDLTTRHFGIVLLVGLTYFGITMAAGVILGGIDAALGIGHVAHTRWSSSGGNATEFSFQQNGSPLNMILSQVLSTFLALGAARIGLNLVSGKAVSVAMLFGEGSKLLRGLGATILFGLMFFAGMLLFIVPGIYIATRYGYFLMAIVDRDLSIMDALTYSSSITTHNRMNLFLLSLMAIAIIIAGILACGVGLIFAMPVVWLTSICAYRWLQYGHRAALDHPGTSTPMLSGVP